ncbi:hypothetical protein E2C01_085851 [Portunus trituberculatus]|uniref:Uncharacterized protein n=1 Tax=Portunus trituberculatus TaxID=210409 RepID=A0A5B7JD14_PORTR|nr:hypothetical protein [Portunus trituberculatus]
MGGSISGGRTSVVTRFKRKLEQPSLVSACATPHSVLTFTAYVCLMIPSAFGVGLPLRPSHISCSTAHSSTPTTLHYAPGVPALYPGHHNVRLAHPPGDLRCSPLPATCCPSPYLCFLEKDRPTTTPVIPTHDYPRAHKDP